MGAAERQAASGRPLRTESRQQHGRGAVHAGPVLARTWPRAPAETGEVPGEEGVRWRSSPGERGDGESAWGRAQLPRGLKSRDHLPTAQPLSPRLSAFLPTPVVFANGTCQTPVKMAGGLEVGTARADDSRPRPHPRAVLSPEGSGLPPWVWWVGVSIFRAPLSPPSDLGKSVLPVVTSYLFLRESLSRK